MNQGRFRIKLSATLHFYSAKVSYSQSQRSRTITLALSQLGSSFDCMDNAPPRISRDM